MTARISKCGHCGETQFTNWYSKSAPRDRYGRMDRDYMDSEPVAYCSEEHRDAADELADAVAAQGALPVPTGDTVLTDEQRAAITELIGNAKPATTGLVLHMAKAVHDRATHEHPTWEDLYCLNLVSWLGERMAPVLRRLLDAEAHVAELEAVPTTIYRAEHPDSGITLGHYGTPAAARAHCEATERRSWPTGTTLVFDWIEDDEDRVAELVVTAGQNEESTTGYIVTSLELDSEYDEEADQ